MQTSPSAICAQRECSNVGAGVVVAVEVAAAELIVGPGSLTGAARDGVGPVGKQMPRHRLLRSAFRGACPARRSGQRTEEESRAMTIELHTWNTPNGRKISVALEEMDLAYSVHPINISQERAIRAGLPRHQPQQPHSRHRRPGRPGRPADQRVRVRRDPAVSRPEDRKVLARRRARAGAGVGMADVADGRFRPDARPGASLPSASRSPRISATGWSATPRRRGGCTGLRIAAWRPWSSSPARFSVADFAILGWAWRHERHQISLDDFPHVKRWYGAMLARPATARGLEVALS